MVGPITTHEPLDDELARLLEVWLPGRRWFPVKGATAQLTVIGGLSLTDPLSDAQVRILLVRAVAPGIDTLVQVPVTIRPATAPGPHPASDPHTGTMPGVSEIGMVSDPPSRVLDGCGDPAFLRAWLAAAQGPGSTADPAHARVLTGEQSNTSVILPAGPAPEHGPAAGAAILKVFRVPSPGANPDVDVPRALAEAGWTHVPRPLAWLEASWPDGDTLVSGHLAVLSELVDRAQDGFELACASARDGVPFTALARELGGVVAGMHTALRAALPVETATPPVETATPPVDGDEAPDGNAPTARAHAVAEAVRERFRWASALVPELADLAGQVERLAAQTERLTGVPTPQRIHGDLHLGQVLRARDTWFVTDFEGEPLAPISARTRPDLALRDVAGMLRSFDYAATVGHAADDGWAASARRGLLDGYLERAAQVDPTSAPVDSHVQEHLLRALELDKALYEAVYEARNRPDWLAIPLGALRRLLGQPPETGSRS